MGVNSEHLVGAREKNGSGVPLHTRSFLLLPAHHFHSPLTVGGQKGSSWSAAVQHELSAAALTLELAQAALAIEAVLGQLPLLPAAVGRTATQAGRIGAKPGIGCILQHRRGRLLPRRYSSLLNCVRVFAYSGRGQAWHAPFGECI